MNNISVGLLCASFTTSLPLLGFLYGFMGGTGFGMVYAPSVIIVGHYFEKYRAIATGIAVCGSGMGTLVMSPLIELSLDKFGWQRTIQIQALCTILCAFVAMLYRPINPIRVYPVEEKTVKFSNVSQTSSQSSLASIASQSYEVNFDRLSKLLAPQNMTTSSRNISNTSIVSQKTFGSRKSISKFL